MSYTIDVKKTPGFHLAAVKFRASVPEMAQQMAQAFGSVMQYLGRAGLQTQGGAVAVYEQEAGDVFDVSAGFVVPGPIEGDGLIVDVEVPAAEVAYTTHIGPYEALPQAYAAIQTWMQQNGREAADTPMWEEYHSGPEVPPTETRTDVYWPLKPR